MEMDTALTGYLQTNMVVEIDLMGLAAAAGSPHHHRDHRAALRGLGDADSGSVE
jgi:hypothetical protein